MEIEGKKCDKNVEKWKCEEFKIFSSNHTLHDKAIHEWNTYISILECFVWGKYFFFSKNFKCPRV